MVIYVGIEIDYSLLLASSRKCYCICLQTLHRLKGLISRHSGDDFPGILHFNPGMANSDRVGFFYNFPGFCIPPHIPHQVMDHHNIPKIPDCFFLDGIIIEACRIFMKNRNPVCNILLENWVWAGIWSPYKFLIPKGLIAY